jgi:hypothetical protein
MIFVVHGLQCFHFFRNGLDFSIRRLIQRYAFDLLTKGTMQLTHRDGKTSFTVVLLLTRVVRCSINRRVLVNVAHKIWGMRGFNTLGGALFGRVVEWSWHLRVALTHNLEGGVGVDMSRSILYGYIELSY